VSDNDCPKKTGGCETSIETATYTHTDRDIQTSYNDNHPKTVACEITPYLFLFQIATMETYRGSNRNLGPVCSCPDWDGTSQTSRRVDVADDYPPERVLHISRAPSRLSACERPPSRGPSRLNTLDRPPSRVSTLDRPPSRPCSRGPMLERQYEHLGSLGAIPQFERPSSRGPSLTGVPPPAGFDHPPSSVDYEPSPQVRNL